MEVASGDGPLSVQASAFGLKEVASLVMQRMFDVHPKLNLGTYYG